MSEGQKPPNLPRKAAIYVASAAFFGIALSLAAMAIWIASLPRDSVDKLALSVGLARLGSMFAVLGGAISLFRFPKYRVNVVLIFIGTSLVYAFFLIGQAPIVL